MGWKGFGEKGRGRVSGVERFWGKGKGLYIFLDLIKPVRFGPV